MPTKFNRVTINATTYVVLDASAKGTCTVIFSTQTNNTVNIVTNATGLVALRIA